MKQLLVAVSLAAALATGCASMSKEECRYVDWRTVGYEDGAAGRPAEPARRPPARLRRTMA